MGDLWQELAPRWERGRELLWESTRAVSEWLVDRLEPQPGQTILDLAAGTGETGFLAASSLGSEGRLITSDLSPPSEEESRLSAKRNPATIRSLLADAGFGEPEIEELPVAYRFANAEELWFFVSELRGPAALALAKLDERERAAVRAEIERRADRAGGGFELTGVSLNVVTS